MAPLQIASKDSTVEVEVPRRALLEPEPVVIGRVLKELRGGLEHVVVGLGLILELVLLGRLLQVRRDRWRGRLGGPWLRLGRFRGLGRMRRRFGFRLEERLILQERITARPMGRFIRRRLVVGLDVMELRVLLESLPFFGLNAEFLGGKMLVSIDKLSLWCWNCF